METLLNGHVIDQELMARIEAIDLSNTRARLIAKKGMNPEEVDQAIADYRKYLYIVIKFEGKHEPTPIIDEVWHDHILHTRKYMQDCQNIAGRYIHHQPYIVEMKADCYADKCSGTTNCQEGLEAKTCDADVSECTHDATMPPRAKTCDGGTCTPCNTDPCVAEKAIGGDDHFTRVEKGDFADVMPVLFGRPVVYAADCGQDGGCQTGDPTCRCN